MRYGNYNDYSGGRSRDSRGRYADGGSYGRRGVPGTGRGRYRDGGSYGMDPEMMMQEMMEYYENYNDSREEMYRGNYGAEGGMVESAEGIMENVYSIVEELSKADSPEVMQVIKKYARKINEM